MTSTDRPVGICALARRSRRVALVLFAALLVACGGGGGGDAPADPAGTPPSGAGTPLTVKVSDTQGAFVSAATVSVASSGKTATTDARGAATIEVPTGSEQLLRISKDGYAVQVQPVTLVASEPARTLQTMLVAREAPVAITTIEAGGAAAGKHGVRVEFPAGSLVNAQGAAVAGTVQMLMTPIDTTTADRRAFPGTFEGAAPGAARSSIASFGTAELVPTQDGQKLALAPGKQATVELPLYATALMDGTPIKVGNKVPLWSLTESTGLWLNEGEGVVVLSAASPTGMAVRAGVSHFSWWNLDTLVDRGTVCLTVSESGAPAGQVAHVEARVVSGRGPTWTASASATVGVRQCLAAAAPGTVQFDAKYERGNLTCQGRGTASVTAGNTVDLTVAVTCVEVPTPVIVVPRATVVTNSRDTTRVDIEVEGPVPDSVELLVNGAVVKTFGPQFFYTHPVDTSALPDGQTATLQARATTAGASRLGNTVNVVIDRTPPRVTTITPAATELVGSATEFTVTFSEPVYAPTFNYNDFVIVSVLLPGAATPTRIDADIVASSNDRVLTIKPKGLVSFGVLSIAWAELRDAAGNTVTDTIASRWSVRRATVLGAGFPTDFFAYVGLRGFAGVAAGANGELFGLSKVAGSGNLQLLRFNAAGNAWSPLGPVINERPIDAQHLGEVAVDASGVVHVAFPQPIDPPSTPTRFELVLRKLVNGAWQDAATAAPMLAGGTLQRPQDFSMTKLLFDASGRAVVAVTQPSVGPMTVFRQQGGAMLALGPSSPATTNVDLALLANGEPLVFGAITGANTLPIRFVQSWNGSTWVAQGPRVPATSTVLDQIAVANGEIWRASRTPAGTVAVERLVNDAWVVVPLPGVQVSGGVGALALDVFKGRPVLAVFGGSQGQVTVYRHNGSGWDEGFDASTGTALNQPRLRFVTTADKMYLVLNNQFLSTVQELAFP